MDSLKRGNIKMSNRKRSRKTSNPTSTNGWDVLKSLIDGLFNFISLNKMAALGVFWYIIRDVIFVFNLPSDYDYSSRLLNTQFLEYLFDNENIIVVIESAIIVFLIIACVALILHCSFLRKEINRMSKIRSEAIHGKEKIKTHTSSE